MKKLDELNLKKKKYIIFDLDGTLIDSIGIWNLADKEIIKKMTKKTIDEKILQRERDEFFSVHYEKDIYLEYSAYLIERYHLKLDKETLLKKRWEIANYYLEHKIDYKENAPVLIKELKKKNYIIILATSSSTKQLDIYCNKNQKMRKKLKIDNYFDLIVCKEDVKKQKPNPEIYEYILKHYHTTPENCIAIEDSLHGITAAKKARIDTINIYDEYAEENRKEIQNLTDYYIENYQELIDKLKD